MYKLRGYSTPYSRDQRSSPTSFSCGLPLSTASTRPTPPPCSHAGWWMQAQVVARPTALSAATCPALRRPGCRRPGPLLQACSVLKSSPSARGGSGERRARGRVRKLYSRTQFFDMRLSGMQASEGLCSSEHAWPGTARRPARGPPSCARESRALRLTTGQGLLQDPRPTAVRGNPSSSPAQGCVELAPRPPRQLHTKCTHGAGSRSTLPPSCARESRALRLTAGQGLLQDPRPTAVRGNPSSSPVSTKLCGARTT